MQVTPSVITPNPPNGPPEPEFQPLQADFPPVPPQEQESEFPDGPLPVQDLTEKPPEGREYSLLTTRPLFSPLPSA
jgi:hypothetical protein